MRGAMRKPHFDTAKSVSSRSSAKLAPVATLGTSQNLARKPDSEEPRRPRDLHAGKPSTSDKPRGRKLLFSISLALLTAGGGAYGYFDAWPKYICRQWEARALAATEADAEEAVDRVAGCGSLGTIALTRLLAAENPAIAEAAQDRLSRLCRTIRDAVESEAPLEPSEVAMLEALAAGMDELAAEYSQDVPAPVADFAWKVLELTGRMKLEERVPMLARGRLTTAADTLLQRPTRPRIDASAIVKPKLPTPQPTVDAAARRRLDARRELASLYNLPQPPVAPSVETPPAGLPTSMPATPLATVEPRSATSDGMSSGIVATPSESPRAADLQHTANAAARINPIRDEAASSNIRQVSTAPSGLEVAPQSEAPSLPSAALQRHLTTRSAWALLGDLQSPGTPQASAAAAELHRRGFSLREIEIGKHLTSADAAERTKYTEQLPSSGIAVKPWLIYLSSDPDAEVRRAAVAIMATSNDPELKAKLRELAITDADEVVRDQAAKSARPATMRLPGGR